MTTLEIVRNWIATFPKYDILSAFLVDYTDQIPANGGVFPSGLVEISRNHDICGNSTVENQLNFGIYTVFEKPQDDDAASTINAEWIMDFQQWVQDQSVFGLAPVFGDDPRKVVIKAQNGVLYSADGEGTATYMVQLSINYIKKYEVKNKWLT